MHPDASEVQATFETLALDAGRNILALRKAGCTVRFKDDKSPVTDADVHAETVILAGLKAKYPAIPIVAEEAVADGNAPDTLGETFMLVDALDGTREFAAGLTAYTVNIALIQFGCPVVGVVYAPDKKMMFTGRPGQAQKLAISSDGEIVSREDIGVCECAKPMRVAASRSHRTPETDAFIADCKDAKVISVGSSLKFCLLASGEADIYPRFSRTMEWDTAAGDAVLRAAGGHTRLVDGGLLTYGKRRQADDCDFANPWFVAEAEPYRGN